MRDTTSFPVAVFLDRDGTINVDTHYPHKPEDLRFYPRALPALARLARYPVRIIIVTNQSGIGRGIFAEADMRAFNARLLAQICDGGGRVDALYYCPHFDASSPVPVCGCSKPLPGLLHEAQVDYGLDLSRSWLVGDKQSDILAGQAVGCRTVLVRTGKAGTRQAEEPGPIMTNWDGAWRGPGYHFERLDLYQAVELIAPALRESRAA